MAQGAFDCGGQTPAPVEGVGRSVERRGEFSAGEAGRPRLIEAIQKAAHVHGQVVHSVTIEGADVPGAHHVFGPCACPWFVPGGDRRRRRSARRQGGDRRCRRRSGEAMVPQQLEDLAGEAMVPQQLEDLAGEAVRVLRQFRPVAAMCAGQDRHSIDELAAAERGAVRLDEPVDEQQRGVADGSAAREVAVGRSERIQGRDDSPRSGRSRTWSTASAERTLPRRSRRLITLGPAATAARARESSVYSRTENGRLWLLAVPSGRRLATTVDLKRRAVSAVTCRRYG